MSKYTDELIIDKTIAGELALLTETFEDMRTKINQYKLDGLLPHQDFAILPFTMGMMGEVIRALIESIPTDKKANMLAVIAHQIKSHVEDILPWDELMRPTQPTFESVN